MAGWGVRDENVASVRHNQICPIREGKVTTSKPALGADVLQPGVARTDGASR